MMIRSRSRMGAISMKISSRLSRVESLMNQGLYWRLLWKLSTLCLRKVWLVATRSVIISIALEIRFTVLFRNISNYSTVSISGPFSIILSS